MLYNDVQGAVMLVLQVTTVPRLMNMMYTRSDSYVNEPFWVSVNFSGFYSKLHDFKWSS